MQLQGQKALVTGSTDGIGRATALLFAEEGAELIISGRDAERGAQVVEEITSAGGKASFIAADLSDLDSLASLAEQVADVDILVNNAGLFVVGGTADTDVPSFDASIALNVRAPFLLTAKLGPLMAQRGSGAIVNVSSMAAYSASPQMAVYSATKAALNALTRTWAAEFAEGGVRVNAVSVGPTFTRAAEAASPEVREAFASTTLLKRLASTREIAQSILFLTAPQSSYVTGTILDVDGGNSAT